MAPKSASSTPKKGQSPLTQSHLSFKTRKSVPTPKAKAKATLKAKAKAKRHDKSLSDSDDDNSASQSSGSESYRGSVNVKKGELDMQDKAGVYANYYREVRQKMGYMPPIHNEGQTKIHTMLRVFDNSYEYGPCVGLTRLERWERAEAMGLKPPPEVRDILLTEQGREDPSLIHTVFHGLV